MAVTSTVPVHRLSVEDVLAMVRAGILDEHARVELEDGVLVDMNPIGPEHEDTLALLTRHFVAGTPSQVQVRVQGMLLTPGGGYVMPDLSVIAQPSRSELPATASLVVEVAQTSQARDREKAALYAAAGVPEYWIVDVVAQVLTVHRDPAGGTYRSISEHRDGNVNPALKGVPPVELDAIFGR